MISFEKIYEDIAVTCFRFFGFRSLDEVDRLSLREYDLLVRAENLRQVDLDYRNHLQAWLNVAAKAEKKTGKRRFRLVYDTFEKFFDYDNAIEKAEKRKQKKQESRLPKLAEFLRKGGAGNG